MTATYDPDSSTGIQAFVLGRLNMDMFAMPAQTSLRDASTYERALGGFAANVAVGLARLGTAVGVVSRVGDDGHGAFARERLALEGVDMRFVTTDPDWLTPLAFVESWPPDDFPTTFYRRPTAPDWQLELGDLDVAELAAAPLMYVSGTGFAKSPSAETTMAAMELHRGSTILDLDYRAAFWPRDCEYSKRMRAAAAHADVVIGNEREVSAAGIEPTPHQTLYVKRGRNGVSVYERGEVASIAPTPVDVVNGLGAGDAFAAAIGYGMLNGEDAVEAARIGSAAGALVASRPWCAMSMPTIDELRMAGLVREPGTAAP